MDLKRPRTPHYDDPVAVGQRLHAAREAAGISQRELAFPGCSAAYISRIGSWENLVVVPPSVRALFGVALAVIVIRDLAEGKRYPWTHWLGVGTRFWFDAANVGVALWMYFIQSLRF